MNALRFIKILILWIVGALSIYALIILFSNLVLHLQKEILIFKGVFLALAMQDISFYLQILKIICLLCLLLFFATRYILGRQVEIRGDFWEHQKLAKNKIYWLNALIIIILGLIFLCAFSLFEIIFLSFGVGFGDDLITNRKDAFKYSMILSVIFALSIFGSYFFKNTTMKNSAINQLAKTLKADEILSTKNEKEKNLLNIVEEMAIASNMPMPRVFIMRYEPSINAMASGERFGYDDECVAIFITQGALEHFSRDELQGVIAHEFSHAFHGDVALNLKIFSLIFGLTFAMILGESFFRASLKSSRSRSKNKGGVIIIALIALVFYGLGLLGQIFAKILQSAISRQKEFLADASSVQYTRNISGIKSALKRIKILQTNQAFAHKNGAGFIQNIQAKPLAHMFFITSTKGFLSKLFATHPSLESRIKALDKIG